MGVKCVCVCAMKSKNEKDERQRLHLIDETIKVNKQLQKVSIAHEKARHLHEKAQGDNVTESRMLQQREDMLQV